MSKHENEDRIRGVIGRPGDQILIHIDSNEKSESIDALREEVRSLRSCLSELTDRVKGKIPRPGLMTKQEVARFLRVSVRQVDRLRASGRLPDGEVVGGRRRWRSEDIVGPDHRDEGRGEGLAVEVA